MRKSRRRNPKFRRSKISKHIDGDVKRIGVDIALCIEKKGVLKKPVLSEYAKVFLRNAWDLGFEVDVYSIEESPDYIRESKLKELTENCRISSASCVKVQDLLVKCRIDREFLLYTKTPVKTETINHAEISLSFVVEKLSDIPVITKRLGISDWS